MVTFKDDFDTLNTEIWDIFDSTNGQASFSVSNSKLTISVTSAQQQFVDAGITLKNTLNLNNSVVEIKIDGLSGVTGYDITRIGVAITNVPYRYYSGANPMQRGAYAHTIDQVDKIVMVWEVIGDARYEAWRNFKSFPVIIRIYINRSGLYFYHVIDGKEFFFHNLDADIDVENAYLSIFLLGSFVQNGGGSGVVDYISIYDAEVPSTPPLQKAVKDVKVPDIPPEVAYPLLVNMMLIFIGNAILGMAEALKK
ncbi:MAG: hypothetical protein QXZ68_05015 [Candidatus Bathyarchaeia archaeon]